MAENLELLRQAIDGIKNEVEDGANTAARVGGAMSSILEYGKEQTDAEIERAKSEEALLNANTGISEYPAFSTTSAYATGDVVNYQGRLYRFTALKSAGDWDESVAEETSLKAQTSKAASTSIFLGEFSSLRALMDRLNELKDAGSYSGTYKVTTTTDMIAFNMPFTLVVSTWLGSYIWQGLTINILADSLNQELSDTSIPSSAGENILVRRYYNGAWDNWTDLTRNLTEFDSDALLSKGLMTTKIWSNLQTRLENIERRLEEENGSDSSINEEIVRLQVLIEDTRKKLNVLGIVSEDGFFVTDNNGLVAMQYGSAGFDVALLSNHFTELIKAIEGIGLQLGVAENTAYAGDRGVLLESKIAALESLFAAMYVKMGILQSINEDGLYITDSNGNVGAKITDDEAVGFGGDTEYIAVSDAEYEI